MPVDVIVETYHRDGARERAMAGMWSGCWRTSDNHKDDIVAYRVVTGAK